MSDLEVLIENGVATLVMNRPEARNALSMDMRKQLAEKLHEIELDSQIRCVVLKGAGDHFMAGGDVKGMGESCLLYTSPSPRDQRGSRMPSSA